MKFFDPKCLMKTNIVFNALSLPGEIEMKHYWREVNSLD